MFHSPREKSKAQLTAPAKLGSRVEKRNSGSAGGLAALAKLNASRDNQGLPARMTFLIGLLELLLYFRLRSAASLDIVKALDGIALHARAATYERDGNQHGNDGSHVLPLYKLIFTFKHR
jgi:hypothetical protein